MRGSLTLELNSGSYKALAMSLPAPSFAGNVPVSTIDEINEKIKSGTFGKILQDYSNGEIKLSMWIPSDLGKSGIHL